MYETLSKKTLAALLLERAPKLASTGLVTDAPDAWLKDWTKAGLIIALEDLDERGIDACRPKPGSDPRSSGNAAADEASHVTNQESLP